MSFLIGLKTEGVTPATVKGLRPELLFAMMVLAKLWEPHAPTDLIFTSITDGLHSPGSKHYTGQAFDLRTRDLSPQRVVALARRLREYLGDEYDIVIEKDHLHCEYDPKVQDPKDQDLTEIMREVLSVLRELNKSQRRNGDAKEE